jgi:hypothetical protein
LNLIIDDLRSQNQEEAAKRLGEIIPDAEEALQRLPDSETSD